MLTAPLMARLYSPEEYGLLGLFIAFTGILQVVATMQYPSAILLPKHDADALALIKGALLLCTSIAIILAGLFMCFGKHLLSGSAYQPVLPWIPLVLFMLVPGVVITSSEAWLFRRGHFLLLSIQGIVTNLGSTAVALALGLGLKLQGGLIIGTVAGAVMGGGVLAVGLARTGAWSFWVVDFSRVRRVLFEYRELPLFAAPTQFLATFVRQLPVLILTALTGAATVGAFNIANRLLGLPSTLFSQSIGTIFTQRAARQFAETGECRELYRKMFWGLLLTTTPVVIVLAIIAPSLFAWLLGERWRVAGEYSRILCWLFAVQLVCTPLSSMMTIARRQAENMWLQIVSCITTVGLMYAAYTVFGTATAVLIGFTIAATATQLYYGIRGFWLSNPVCKRQ
jgi:O-antigen/teichoic acid export membrane protein